MKGLIILLVLTVCSFCTFSQYKNEEAKGIEMGEKVTDFSIISSDSSWFTLSDAVQNGPVVLVFYRGSWCPICNRHLKTLQDSLGFIIEKGGQVFAISPDEISNLRKTQEKNDIDYTLLSDPDYKIAEMFDVNFVPDESDVKKYNQFLNAQLGISDELPIPAVYIINQNLEITWRFFNPDYRKRASVKEIIEHL
jgi:peroxiredoxin